MCLDKKLQCKTTYADYRLWHVKRICKHLTPEAKQELLLQIQATQLAGKPVANQEAYATAMKLLSSEAKND